MWVILPFLQEYYRSGQFTQINKVKDSIKSNLKFQLMVGAIGIFASVYYFMKFGFNFQIFKSLLIALSHTYSLILSLWLMAHGLINIPRRRWNNNFNLNHQLETLYLSLPKIYDELNESSYNFKDVCSTIKKLESINGIGQSFFKNEVAFLINQIPKDLILRNHVSSVEFSNLDQINLSVLSNLHSRLKNETTNFESCKYEFNKVKMDILKYQDIMESKATKSLNFRFNQNFTKNARLNFIIHLYLIPLWNMFSALVLFGLSLIIIESELLHSTKFSIINILLLTDKISSTGKLIISIIFISYMALSALISLTRIKIFKIYHLFPKHSNPVSVVWFTMYSNRLTIPLSFNFLTLLQTGKIHSNFDDFLGKSINLSMLGGFFNNNLPRLIIIPILLTAFNFFDKLKQKLTFGYFDDFDEEENEGTNGDLENLNKKENIIKEAKSIIQREVGSMSARNSSTNLRGYTDSPASNSRSNLVNQDQTVIHYEQEDDSILDKLKNINVFDRFKTINFFDRFKSNGSNRLNIPEDDEDVDVL